MPTPQPDAVVPPQRLRTARVIRVREHACEVWSHGEVSSAGFAPMFPSPRVERVSPGHLVAIATGPDGTDVVLWRWYDAVVLSTEDDGSVRLWEPAHGEVIAQPRESYSKQDPGSRAYASAGLPGAEWWVAGGASGVPQNADVELDDVSALYAENNLWAAVFDERLAPGAAERGLGSRIRARFAGLEGELRLPDRSDEPPRAAVFDQ